MIVIIIIVITYIMILIIIITTITRALRACKELNKWELSIEILFDLLEEKKQPGQFAFELTLQTLANCGQVCICVYMFVFFFIII